MLFNINFKLNLLVFILLVLLIFIGIYTSEFVLSHIGLILNFKCECHRCSAKKPIMDDDLIIIIHKIILLYIIRDLIVDSF